MRAIVDAGVGCGGWNSGIFTALLSHLFLSVAKTWKISLSSSKLKSSSRWPALTTCRMWVSATFSMQAEGGWWSKHGEM